MPERISLEDHDLRNGNFYLDASMGYLPTLMRAKLRAK